MNDQVYTKICESHGYSKPNRLKFYFENWLFKGIELKGKRLLDIGGGKGAYSFPAALKGAEYVLVLEPEIDGSSSGMIDGFRRIHASLENPENIQLITDKLEGFCQSSNQTFDVILMHNVINHIDEDACIKLPDNRAARQTYLSYFDMLAQISAPGARLIVCDCSNRNFWARIFGTNPMLKSIEWEKHCAPEEWSALLSEKGFRHIRTSWTSPNLLGRIGQLLLSNKLAAYFTFSHFRLEMQYHTTPTGE